MIQHIRRLLGSLNLLRLIRRLALMLANARRRRFKKLDYILLTLPESMPALPESRGWIQARVLGKPPISLWDIERIFQRIADDPRPKGIVLHLRGLSLSLAQLESLRDSITRLRERGKRVICYAQDYDNATYFLASAADAILLQPGGSLMTVGLHRQAMFLKDALDTVGVDVDVVAISPFKSALDQFARSDFSPESRQQFEWLLDSQYAILVKGVADGRGLTEETARAFFDSAPYLDTDAQAAGYVDGVCHEEGLAKHLGVEPDHLIPWHRASKILLKKWRKRADKYVALLPLNGMIVPGESGKPPIEPPIPLPFIGGERMGDLTVVRQVRELMGDKDAAAVVLVIDSPGGSASASEAMTAALRELAKDRPVVVYMDSVAASGGYYISTPAQWIVAQPGTITGSIGVIMAKTITNNLWAKLRTNRVELTRGANAGLMSDMTPFSASQRQIMEQQVKRIYDQFVDHVSRSRNMTFEAVDAIGGGRVWTGAQAKDNGLVDELGDLQAALTKARQLADLPDDSPVALMTGKGKPLAPQLAEQANPAALLRYLEDNRALLFSGTAQMLMPYTFE